MIGKRSSNTDPNSGVYMAANETGKAMKRIRTPHVHDVLCGRGGGINSHEGNVVFRKWVAERKERYNTATSKAEKARLSREIVDLVANQFPPGRFLTRDGTSITAFWVEIDDVKSMAKTSQALREGASEIRAQAEMSKKKGGASKKRAAGASASTRARYGVGTDHFAPIAVSSEAVAMAAQVANAQDVAGVGQKMVESAGHRGFAMMPPPLAPNTKFHATQTGNDRIPTPQPNNVTPNLQSIPVSPSMEDMWLLPEPPTKRARHVSREHSLALTDLEHDLEGDFANPFEHDHLSNENWLHHLNGNASLSTPPDFVNPFENEIPMLALTHNESPSANNGKTSNNNTSCAPIKGENWNHVHKNNGVSTT